MTSRRYTRFGALALAFSVFAAACGGESNDLEATVGEVADAENTSITPTEDEYEAFHAPADSVLTEEQVVRYLKTSLLQFDYVRDQSKDLHERARKIEERGEKGGVVAGLRNMAAGVTLVSDFGNVVVGSFVRAARTQGYNPAEMEWVRERMVEASAYLMTRPMMDMAVEGAAQMKRQAEELRKQLAEGELAGFTEADIDEMVANAEEMEREARENAAAQGAVARNVEVLARARPAVTDPMWAAIGVAGGGMGLMALSGLGDPENTEAQAELDEFRRLYTDALENRVTPGMEKEEPAG